MGATAERIVTFTKESPAVEALSAADEQLGALIERIGDYDLRLRTDYFASLVRAVVGQQLSVKAARTIWARLADTCGGVCPEGIIIVPDCELRGAGLSRPKIAYIKDLSRMALSGGLPLDDIHLLDDGEVIDTLTRVKGIGRWTAEMFLIFSLGRPDILSLDDVGLRKAMKWLYRLGEPPGREAMTEYGERWKPFRSAASLYLWEAVNRGYVTGR